MLKFKNKHRELEQPLLIPADFECLTEKVEGPEQSTEESYTRKYQKHTPCAYGLVPVKRIDGKTEFGEYKQYRGEDVEDRFLDEVIVQAEEHHKSMKQPLAMTQEDWKEFNGAVYCHICAEELGDDRVRDHCHISGKFRGAASLRCPGERSSPANPSIRR